MNKKTTTALDEYINKVYAITLVAATGACQCAGIVYTVEKLLGLVPMVNMIALLIFDLTCLIYLSIAIVLVKTGYENKIVKESKLKQSKIFLIILMFIQFNFIMYMMPMENFWAFMFFFVSLGALFLDYKLVAITEIEIFVSIVAGWFIKGDSTLPAKDVLFIPSMINKVICLVLSMSCLFSLIYLVNKFLVTAKKDEMQKSNEKVLNVLNSVAELSDRLGNTGNKLSDISNNESSSAEELAATSENLLESSSRLGQKSSESIDNLNDLQQWEQKVSEQVEKVESSSRQLLDKSRNNESKLNSLKKINEEVSQSVSMTNQVAERLTEAVKEIDVALNVINDISSSTSLLALNASIEAARAGEAGKGFAVVAQSVGALANDTQNSLGQVSPVVQKIQGSVAEMMNIVNDNTEKLKKQNEYFNSVFTGIQEMIDVLQLSIENIATMGDAHDKQAVVIKNTVQINKEIADSIMQENKEFANINNMAEDNARDIEQITAQVNILNQMVNEINSLLSQEK